MYKTAPMMISGTMNSY